MAAKFYLMIDQIYSYREMCDEENVQTLQRGMNFRMNPGYSVILMSRRKSAPYKDTILEDGITIKYEGHDQPKSKEFLETKTLDQVRFSKNGTLTQNGLFISAVEDFLSGRKAPEMVKIYEKIMPGVWSLKGFFDLVGYDVVEVSAREVFVFTLKLSESQNSQDDGNVDIKHTRLIPSIVKMQVWKRDGGRCVLCESNKNLHYDHELPFSKGGASSEKNIRLLCAKCNLSKSDRIE